jgi:hypothetical protein
MQNLVKDVVGQRCDLISRSTYIYTLLWQLLEPQTTTIASLASNNPNTRHSTSTNPIDKTNMGRTEGREMEFLYGEHWASRFNVNIHNIRTKNVGPTHHCSYCKAPPMRSCYLNLHLAFCVASIDIHGKTDICGERFCPKSPGGCAKHTYKDDFNQIVKDAFKNVKSISQVMEDLEIAKKLEGLTLKSEEPEDKPILSYEQYNELNKQKVLTTKRGRHEAVSIARSNLRTKGKVGTKLATAKMTIAIDE